MKNKINLNNNGELHGTQFFYRGKKLRGKEYYDNGILLKSESYYDNGSYRSVQNYNREEKLDGVQIFYHPNGKLAEKTKYRNGEIVEMESYYESGNKKSEINRSGIKEYYENTELKMIKEMKNNILNGISCDFKRDGEIKSIKYIENGEIIGSKEYIEIDSMTENFFDKTTYILPSGDLTKIEEFENSYETQAQKLTNRLIEKQKNQINRESEKGYER